MDFHCFSRFLTYCGSMLVASLVTLAPRPTLADPPPTAALAAPVEPRDETPLPTPEEVAARLKSVQEDPTLAQELKSQLVESLTELAKLIPDINKESQRRDSLVAAAAVAGEEIAKCQRLKAIPSEASKPATTMPRNLAEVRAQKEEIDSRLEANLQQQQAIETELRKREERRKSLPQLLIDSRTLVQKLESEPPPVVDPALDARLQQVRQELRAARLKKSRAELGALQQEGKTYEAEAELLPLRRELLMRDVLPLKEASQRLSSYLANQRNYDIESLRLKLQSLGQGATQRELDEVRKTLELLNQWSDVVRDSVRMEERMTTAKSEASSMAKELEDLRKKVAPEQNNAALSTWVGLYLQRKREQLPNVGDLRRELLNQQEQMEKTESLLAGVNSRLDELRASVISEQGAETPLQAVQRESLEKMKTDLDKYVGAFFSLSAERERMIRDVVTFQQLVDEQLLWMRSASPIQTSDLGDAWRAFQVMVHPEYLRELRHTAATQLYRRFPITLLWVTGTIGLYILATRLRRRLHLLGDQASKRNATQMQPTWLALTVTTVLAMPLVFALALPGWLLCDAIGSLSYVHAVGFGLLVGAWFLLPLEMLRQIARPNGLGVAHFGWPAEIAQPLRSNLRWMIDLGIPLVIAWAATEQQRDSRDNVVSLARLLFTGLMLVVAIILWRVAHPSYGVLHPHLLQRRGGWLDRLRYVWHPGLTGIPLLFAGFSLAGYGYLAGRLAIRLFESMWVVLGVVMIGGMLTRWVLLSRRRMLLAQLQHRAEQARRDETRDQSGAAIEVSDASPVDVSQVSQQTLRLIRALLWVGGLAGMAWVWSSVLPALNVLDQVELWDRVTLTNLLLTIPIAVMTVVAVRNLPGLLETMILQHLPLESAARYAIKTLSSYTLAFIGILVSARVLGLHWDSIQWLVAALGVGLGFGLQEIFANFISGIILLFEQPIRVGDVITIDGVTGVVSRIRIRATTVTNWDRQELIIPNKDLITGRLLNWTLSDSVNRVVIKVGVAYGTDTRLACDMLNSICCDHPNISKEPPPSVAFEEFANSSLTLTIRAFLNSLELRLPTIHELHTQIHEAFQSQGIEIAYPQQDIRIRTLPSDWITRESPSSKAA